MDLGNINEFEKERNILRYYEETIKTRGNLGHKILKAINKHTNVNVYFETETMAILVTEISHTYQAGQEFLRYDVIIELNGLFYALKAQYGTEKDREDGAFCGYRIVWVSSQKDEPCKGLLYDGYSDNGTRDRLVIEVI